MGATRSAAEAMESAMATPIAQLNPDLQDTESRAVDGVVTITWPYSVVTRSIALIIAEQDPLRRRDKGQLRVECHGPAGKALADSGIGGGDNIRLSLVGAEWDVAHAKTHLPAGSQDWQLKFTKRLLLRARKTESQEPVEIDIDAPVVEEVQAQPSDVPARDVTPPPPEPLQHDLAATPVARPATVPAKRLASSMLEPDEFTSPAFLKRARVSYGSLFEDGFDLFAEDKVNKPKAKRKSRFSMGQTAWKYSSRSPSPEPEPEPELEEPANHPNESTDGSTEDQGKSQTKWASSNSASPRRPPMVDEGCQTQDLYFSPSMHVQVSAEPRHSHDTTTLAYPEARHDHVHTTPYTPSRNLFGQGSSQVHNISGAMPGPLMDFHAPDPHHHDYGLNMEVPHHGVLADDLFGEHSTEHTIPVTSDAAFGGSVSALSYPDPPFGADNYAPMHGIDPNLHAHDTAPVHTHDDVAQQDNVTWQNDSLTTQFSSQPISGARHYGIVTSDSSPSVQQEAFLRERGSSADTSIPDRQRPIGQGQSKSPEQSGTAAGASDSFSRDGTDPEHRDGGDLPGEDYDLRNYDRARDDDESVSESEEGTSESNQADPDKAAIDFSEEEEEDEEEEEAEEDEEEDEEIPHQHPGTAEEGTWNFGRRPAATTQTGYEAEQDSEAESDSDVGQEYYGGREFLDEDEEDYDDDEAESSYDEEEEAPPPPAPAAPAEPVFISLLSDSEDEDEVPPRNPLPSAQQPPAPKQDDQATKGPSVPSASGSDREANVKQEHTSNVQSSPEDEHMSDKDAEEASEDAEEGPEGVDDSLESVDEDESIDEADNSYPSQPPERAKSFEGEKDADYADGAHVKEVQQTLVGSQLDGVHEDVPVPVVKGKTFSGVVHSKAESQPEPQRANILEVDTAAKVAAVVQPAVVIQPDQTQASDSGQVDENIKTFQTQLVGDKEPANVTRAEPSDAATELRDDAMPDAPHDEPIETQTEGRTQSTAIAAEEEGEPISSNHKDGKISSHEAPTTSGMTSVEEPFGQLTNLVEAQHAEEQQPKSGLAELEKQINDDDDVAAEAQIMNEYYSSQSSSRIGYDQSGTHGGSQIHGDEPLITVRSLRSHSHRKTLSADTTSDAHDDPSVRLATAHSGMSQSPAQEAVSQLPPPTEAPLNPKEGEQSGKDDEAVVSPQGKKQKELKTLSARRATRNEAKQPITQGSCNALPPSDDEKLSSHLTLRASRSKNTRPDPSLQLSKALADDGDRHAEADRQAAVARSVRGMRGQAEPDVQPAKTPPSSGRSTRRHDTPETTRELRSRSHVEARAITPETASNAAMQSPSVAESVTTETEDVSALKKELQRLLRTGLPDALPLRSLRTSLNKTVDIMAVSTTAPPQPHRPRHGPRDYMLELIVTDPSTAPTSVSVAHVFRPHLEYLPVVHAGDVVLLRRMQVVSVKGRGFGVRVGDASAWAVFEKGDEELLPQIKGPPVEITDGEVEYAKGLRRWWATLDDKTRAKIDRATQKASQS
ncbi:hypothetical protein JDV02_005202 [Purpureocillium takamizusanense]|uniref:Telomeric single stranded DNA binding POT1/Cdc13 domain-containing protein n=1 Tax=Purpureocillium takamizusanense TaxID=2060973 RepID=A0A9Q8QHH5_9HYPO|nr:uncharacterized protein JDV02_005202 [Purpureocillium takamizusanense]UNI18976.1 hypothetical protein JDV02_005202 [Purpureocillium takamizusanense]